MLLPFSTALEEDELNFGGIPYSAGPEDFIPIDEGFRWECIGCGKCCGNVFTRTWLDVSLREYIGEPVDGHCRHLENNRCLIHPRRPNICRGYPFILKRVGEHYEIRVHSHCSGIGNGPELDIRAKVLEVVRLAEDEFDMDLIIEWSDDPRRSRIFKIR